jgi:two-component system sensor histidine kinase and response regulator WspE
MSDSFGDISMLELFRLEAEDQVRTLQDGLLVLEKNPGETSRLETLMRAAHSLKGAASIVGLKPLVQLAHAMEDRLVAAQKGRVLDSGDVDRLLAGTDWIAQMGKVAEKELPAWLEQHQPAMEAAAEAFRSEAAAPSGQAPASLAPASPLPEAPAPETSTFLDAARENEEPASGGDRSVRVAADRLNRLLAHASECLVASRLLPVQTEALERLRRSMQKTALLIRETEAVPGSGEPAHGQLHDLGRQLEKHLAEGEALLAELDLTARENEREAGRLYREVLASRLRPFSEATSGIARTVRDLSRQLGKLVRLEISGERTEVDRDILEKLEAPLNHLVRNALDHGVEAPDVRLAAGKPAEAVLTVQARHENGRLAIVIGDDGAGIDRSRLRAKVLARHLVNEETAARLSDAEWLEFLFLPGFSTREEVTEVSGRGVGLDVVQAMVQETGGSVTVTSEPGRGTQFHLTLPVTRSVIRALRVAVEGETYAVPLARISGVLQENAFEDAAEPGRPRVRYREETLPVAELGLLLGLEPIPLPKGPLSLVVCGNETRIAFAVDRLIDTVELAVRPLDPRLGKIPGVSSAALDEDGAPLLILDTEDLVQTALDQPSGAAAPGEADAEGPPRILVVDDSHTVREMERRLLSAQGYRIQTAQNGREAWNLLRLGSYDLVISDVDMPLMNGIELVSKIRRDPRLGRMPVIILSYKDLEADRKRGLEAGADYYLTKGSFQNDSFLRAVTDLIGPAQAPGSVEAPAP